MIYCVLFSDVRKALLDAGFEEAGRTDRAVIFVGPGGRRAFVHPPNQDGHVPEILVNDAFDAAGLVPPRWTVFWCD